MGSYATRYVPRDELDRHWEVYAPWLERMPLNGFYDLAHLRVWLVEGKRNLWEVVDTRATPPEVVACLVTSVEDYPLVRVGRIQLCAGENLAAWLDLLPELEGAMRTAGCERIEVYGRKGWERVLPGYRVQAVVLSKEL